MAVYGTDLVTMTDAESGGTWTEFASPYNGGGTPGADGENYIQGQDCMSQTLGTKTGLIFSVVFDAGSDISGSFATGDVFLIWQFFAVGSAITDYSNGGLRVGVGSSVSAWNSYDSGGNNYGRNPYGGWQNIAVDPTLTADDTIGGGNGGAWRYFGSIVYTIAQISKGSPHAVDAIRYGRGELYCTGTGATIAGLAQASDYNGVGVTGNVSSGSAVITNVSNTLRTVVGATLIWSGFAAGTTIVSVDSATQITVSNTSSSNGTGVSLGLYNKFGLFQSQQGTILWKGLLSFGQAGTSVTFTDSNKTIIVDDTPKAYLAFNKIEVNHASSSVTWNNISIISTGTLSPGQFEAVDNATIAKTGCLFVDMDTFIYQSNSTIISTTFQGCNTVTSGGGTFTGSKVLQSSVAAAAKAAAFIWDETTDPNGELDDMEFSKGTASHHAIYFGESIPSSITLTGIAFSGFNAADAQTDSTLYFNDSTGTITVNLVSCTGNITYHSNGCTVVFVINPVALTLTFLDNDLKTAIENVAVTIWPVDASGPLPFEESVTIAQTGGTATVTHNGHGLATGQWVEIKGADQDDYNRLRQITKLTDNTYTYVVHNNPTSPATGTITATAVIINGYTNASGIIADTRSYSGDQTYTGKGLKGTSLPVYKEGSVSGTIDSGSGGSASVFMTPD